MSLIAYDGQIELEEDDWADEDLPDEEDDGDEWRGCVFGAQCVMPDPHFSYECYTAEMAEEWASGEGKE